MPVVAKNSTSARKKISDQPGSRLLNLGVVLALGRRKGNTLVRRALLSACTCANQHTRGRGESEREIFELCEVEFIYN